MGKQSIISTQMQNMKKLIQLCIIAISFIFFSCDEDSTSGDTSSSEAAVGSYANMLTYLDRLYLISTSEIITMDITDRSIPVELDRQTLGFNIESLFRRGETLFIGSATDLYIYGIADNGIPKQLSVTTYGVNFPICSRDPVVTNDSIAYVTLSTTISDNCGRTNTNELKLLDISELTDPVQLNAVDMISPKGLGLDGNWLFVCEQNHGLKVFDVSDPREVTLIHHFDGYRAFDVIVQSGLLIVVGPDDLYQYDYSDMDDMHLVSVYRIT